MDIAVIVHGKVPGTFYSVQHVVFGWPFFIVKFLLKNQGYFNICMSSYILMGWNTYRSLIFTTELAYKETTIAQDVHE